MLTIVISKEPDDVWFGIVFPTVLARLYKIQDNNIYHPSVQAFVNHHNGKLAYLLQPMLPGQRDQGSPEDASPSKRV